MRNYSAPFCSLLPWKACGPVISVLWPLFWLAHIFIPLLWIVKGRGNEGLAFLYSGLFMARNNGWPPSSPRKGGSCSVSQILDGSRAVLLFITLSYIIHGAITNFIVYLSVKLNPILCVCHINRYYTIITLECISTPLCNVVCSEKKNWNLVKIPDTWITCLV